MQNIVSDFTNIESERSHNICKIDSLIVEQIKQILTEKHLSIRPASLL